MAENKDVRQEENNVDDSKTELANRIANQSKKVARTYEHIEENALRMVRWFSSFIDRTLFNSKYAKIVSLVLAVLLYVLVNYDSQSSIYTTTLRSSKDLTGVSVTAKYNSDMFELSGLPATADITISGDATSVTSAANSKGVVVANLEGLTEGTHEVKLSTEGYGDSVSVKINPSNVFITLKKKTTQQFDLTYDFINQDKMESIYSVGVPVFEYNKVNVRASKDTLSSIAFVKALIDVTGQTSDFTQEALLIAYDSSGRPVEAYIYPSTIQVTVPVTSPNKSVPIEVEVSGEVPEGLAISGITMDQQSVTIFGPEAVLGQIDKVVVTLNASTITKDSTIMRPITLPAGVNSSNINQITMTVTLGESTTKTITDVPINAINNINNYLVQQTDKTTVNVTVTGTEENIEHITAEDIYVYIDMKDAKPGLQEFALEVRQPSSGLIRYTVTEAAYELNVLGETSNDSTTEGTDVNNG
ncbi:MAG: hypothetical protein K6D03_01895 [Solobacterium sp.]|nr:hypothetical protein [Solobacterium sp.]